MLSLGGGIWQRFGKLVENYEKNMLIKFQYKTANCLEYKRFLFIM